MKKNQAGESEIAKGLKLKKIDAKMVRLAKPVEVPEGWSPLAAHAIAPMWKYILDPDGKGLWVRLCDGHTQSEPPFVVDRIEEEATASAVRGVKSEIGRKQGSLDTAHNEEEIRREVWTDDQLVSEAWETIPIPPELRPKFQDVKARAEAVTSRMVMSTTGDEYLRWRNAVKKEHDAFVKKQAFVEATKEDLMKAKKENISRTPW